MGWYSRSMHRLSTTKAMRWTLMTFQPTIDRLLKDTRFHSAMGTPVQLCFVTTTGRKSGEPRCVPLTYVKVPDGLAIVATNYGQDHHPAWSHNLDADPNCTIEIGAESYTGAARRATEDEATEFWPQFETVWPGYSTYREIAPRDIKMYIVEAEPAAMDPS